jgi:GNAT superfamily N-acetyltransferase
MPTPRLRPMTAEDVEPTAAAILTDRWGDRRAWFEFAVGSSACRVVVAEDADGVVVGTGVATINGPVGWIGTIWVAPAQRGRGLGTALTQWTIDAAESSGCRTLVLVATDRGRPLYEKLGFEVQTWYRTMEAPGLPATGGPVAPVAPVPADPRIRPFESSDLDGVTTLDRRATGEDRREVIAALANADGTRILDGEDGPAGFVIRAPWGGGATVASSVDDALAILHTRRLVSGPDKRVRCGILLENEAGAEALEADGWTEAWRAPRLVRGAPLAWRPERIWGQFNHAMG